VNCLVKRIEGESDMAWTTDDIESAIEWLGEAGNWTADDCDVCDNGEVWHGLVMILPKGERHGV